MADAFKGSGAMPALRASKWISATTSKAKRRTYGHPPGCRQRPSFAEDLAARVQKGDLVIRDLGYFCLNFFAYLTSIGAIS